jgi:hypothetical protein
VNLDFFLTTAKYAVLTGVALGVWYLAGIVMLSVFCGLWNGTMDVFKQPAKQKINVHGVSRWAYVCWPMFLVFSALIVAFWVVVLLLAGGHYLLDAAKARLKKREA